MYKKFLTTFATTIATGMSVMSIIFNIHALFISSFVVEYNLYVIYNFSVNVTAAMILFYAFGKQLVNSLKENDKNG